MKASRCACNSINVTQYTPAQSLLFLSKATWDPKVGKASGNGKCCKGLKMTNFWSKHVALLENKKGCADVYCVTLIELFLGRIL